MSEQNNVENNVENKEEKKPHNFKEERLWYYICSVFSALVSAGIIEVWIEAGKVVILGVIFSGYFIYLLLGALATFLAIFNFKEIDKDKRNFWDYFFIFFLVIGGLGSIFGFVVFLIVRVITWYLKDEFSKPVNSTHSEKTDEYHVGKDVAGYDRIYNQDGKEITTVASVDSRGNVHGTDGNKYTPK